MKTCTIELTIALKNAVYQKKKNKNKYYRPEVLHIDSTVAKIFQLAPHGNYLERPFYRQVFQDLYQNLQFPRSSNKIRIIAARYTQNYVHLCKYVSMTRFQNYQRS